MANQSENESLFDPLADDADYEDYIVSLLWPNYLEWAAVPLFLALLFVGLVGNFLVIFVVIRNAQMRSATNIFLVNLAVSDFLVMLFCLPFSVLWDITKTWWFGTTICRCTIFFQNLSVTVSVLTLVCISVERWYVICNPLKFKVTLRWTLRLLFTVWMAGILLSIPEFVTLTTKPYEWGRPNFSTPWLTTCVDTWGPEVNKYYQFAQTIALFIIPLVIISFFYANVVRTLWAKSPAGQVGTRFVVSGGTDGGGTASTTYAAHQVVRQEAGRRKAAKMLIVVVVLFVVCYFPVHMFNMLRELEWLPKMTDQYQIAAVKLLIRFLTYFNSCVNPIIYNFMSEKFQREYRLACGCRSGGTRYEQTLTSLIRSRLTSRNPSTMPSASPSHHRIARCNLDPSEAMPLRDHRVSAPNRLLATPPMPDGNSSTFLSPNRAASCQRNTHDDNGVEKKVSADRNSRLSVHLPADRNRARQAK